MRVGTDVRKVGAWARYATLMSISVLFVSMSGCEMFVQQSDLGWTRADGRTPGSYQGMTETGASSTPNARNWGGHPSVPMDRRVN